jgi:hypothetical protein
MLLEVGITQTIKRSLRASRMLTAIQFDDQFSCVASKVGDKRTDRCLAPEM